MANSYSSIKLYKQCPKQYHAVRVLREYTRPQSEASMRGERIHKALELYARDGEPLTDEAAPYKHVVDTVTKALCENSEAYYEYEFAISKDKKPVNPKDYDKVFWSGKADVLCIKGPTAYVLDYKTGKSKYADTDQLELMAYFTFLTFPSVQSVGGMLLFMEEDVALATHYTRQDVPRIENKWGEYIENIEFAHEAGFWPEKKSPLCAFCPVKTCMYYKGKP